nr:hypothetical protein [uncultured Acetatifactor sp.]
MDKKIKKIICALAGIALMAAGLFFFFRGMDSKDLVTMTAGCAIAMGGVSFFVEGTKKNKQ